MIAFYVVSTLMLAVALLLVVRPLLKTDASGDNPVGLSRRSRIVTALVVAAAIPLVATLLYRAFGRPNWQAEMAAASAAQSPANKPDIEAMVAKLEARLHDQPNDVEGWIMLGRSYVVLEKIPAAIAAYEKAYAQSNGENLDATLGLAEALVFADEKSLSGRAGDLFEAVLTKQPDNPKALWYGAVSELSRGNLSAARDRMRHMLQLNPPDNIRSIIERQVQDIEQQLAQAGAPANAPPAAGVQSSASAEVAASQVPASLHSLQVEVTLAPQLAKSLNKAAALFVLARAPNGGGPPLAVKKLTARELPLSITLSDRDAMIQGHGLGSVSDVQVVARVSTSGTPQAQPGDLFGEAPYSFAAAKAPGRIRIVIDRVVP